MADDRDGGVVSPEAPDGGVCDPSELQFPNIGLDEAPGQDGCPDGMVRVTEAFCIDTYEASLQEIRPDGTVHEWSPYHNPEGRRVRAVSRAYAVPQGYIRGDQAAAACAEAGKRLCSDTEWLRACRGSDNRLYPYGSPRRDGACNDYRSLHPAVELYGTGASWVFSRIGNPCINQLPMSLAPSGQFGECQTESGAFDMVGNLHEWTSNPTGVFRGGFYVHASYPGHGTGCTYQTGGHTMSDHYDYSTGFRCCW